MGDVTVNLNTRRHSTLRSPNRTSHGCRRLGSASAVAQLQLFAMSSSSQSDRLAEPHFSLLPFRVADVPSWMSKDPASQANRGRTGARDSPVPQGRKRRTLSSYTLRKQVANHSCQETIHRSLEVLQAKFVYTIFAALSPGDPSLELLLA